MTTKVMIIIACFVTNVMTANSVDALSPVMPTPQTIAIQPSSREAFVKNDRMEDAINDAFELITEGVTKKDLLETIRFCAAKSEILPIYIFDYPSSWLYHYENTFSRFLPFYLFKTKVGLASRQELEECVGKFDELNNKEKAYVLTAILIFERAKRKRSDDFYKNRQKNIDYCRSIFDKRKNNGLYVPYFVNLPYFSGRTDDVLYPPYEPDETIDDATWTRWIKVVRDQIDNQEIAFPAFRANELAPNEKFPYRFGPYDNIPKNFTVAFDDCSLALEWLDSQRFCLYVIKKYFDLDAPKLRRPNPPETTAFAFLTTLLVPFQTDLDEPLYDFIRQFLERTEEFNPNSTEKELLIAVRDYWFTFQVNSHSLSYDRNEYDFCCNSSAFSRSLSEIATYVLNRRYYLYYNDKE